MYSIRASLATLLCREYESGRNSAARIQSFEDGIGVGNNPSNDNAGAGEVMILEVALFNYASFCDNQGACRFLVAEVDALISIDVMR